MSQRALTDTHTQNDVPKTSDDNKEGAKFIQDNNWCLFGCYTKEKGPERTTTEEMKGGSVSKKKVPNLNGTTIRTPTHTIHIENYTYTINLMAAV